MLTITNLTYRAGGRLLFNEASATVGPGRRVGLVGPNGCGKTTLFRLIEGEIVADGGAIQLPKGAGVVRVAQEAPGGSESLVETVLAADRERARLTEQSETSSDPNVIAEAHVRLAEIGAHAAPARAASILAGLGFNEQAQAGPCAALSGGWRMRVALAAALFAPAEILLLDEPTNHLDLEATLWLEAHLAKRTGTLLLISHERRLLNNAVDEILHLDGGLLVRYNGGYDVFERTRAERLTHQAKFRERQLAERERIQSFVDRFRAKASKARQAQSRLKMLERMEPVAAMIENRVPLFQFVDTDPLPPPILALEDAAAGYGEDKPVIRHLNLTIGTDDRIGLLGANGNGKSTLIRLLAGKLRPLAGAVRHARALRVGHFDQHQADALPDGISALALARQRLPSWPDVALRSHIARFGIDERRASTDCTELSGGERARLVLALVAATKPHLLLLDEPTNHLDVDAREALVQAVGSYNGAVVLVTHDPHLVELMCDQLWLVSDGTCRPLDGDLDDYRVQIQGTGQKGRGTPNQPGGSNRQTRQTKARARADTAELRQALKAAEARLQKLEGERKRIEQRLADPDLYSGSAQEVTRLQKDLATTHAELARCEDEWLRASTALDAPSEGA